MQKMASGQKSAVFLVFLLLISSLSLVLSASNQNTKEPFLSGEDPSYEAILPLSQLNIPGFQEGSIYTNATLSSGYSHTCSILDDGSVSCWGYNSDGQLGDGTATDRYTPTQTSSLGSGRTAVAITAGAYHTCAILDDGSVSCWGYNTYGQLGDGTNTDRNTPTQTSSLGEGRTVVAITASEAHTCTILDNGFVSCWGYNGYGQLGDGTTTDRDTPTQTSSTAAVAISAGYQHTCAILDDGSVSCWGRNSNGQLGDGTNSHRNTPTQTSTLGTDRTAVSISAGDRHTCAILDDESVSCWGFNNFGQLGDGTTTDRDTPTQTSSLGSGRTAVAITAGNYHTCAILDDASVSCWGYNIAGQLGDGTNTDRNTSTQTSSLGTIQNPRTAALSERDLDGDGILNIFDSTPYPLNNPNPITELSNWTVSPSSGPSEGGTDLTISGSGFSSLLDNLTLPENTSEENIRSWTNSTIDSNANVGSHTSIAVDSNDNLHISYFGAHNSDLKYATYDGSSWNESFIDSGFDVGKYTSIAVDSNDNVHISYYDSSNADLKYTTSIDGTSWTTSTVDSNGSVGEHTSIAVDSNDNVHISYYDSSNAILKYATSNGNSWSISTVDNMPVGEYTSIAVDSNDNVHISYYDFFNANLKYATYNGSSWSNSTVDSTNGVGKHTSIAVDSNDDLHISYLDSSVGNIKYATHDGTNWTTSLVDGAGSVGDYTSLAVDSNGNVHISYFDYSNADLKYATFVDNVNGSGWITSTVDSAGDVGFFTSIAVDSNDDVHISYQDNSNGNLKYAKLPESNSSVSTNEITIQFEEYGNVTGTVVNDSIITVTTPPGLTGETLDLTLWAANGSGYVLTSAFTYLPDSDTDDDGIDNELDDCPNSAGNSTIDQIGCPDSDGDGYSNSGDSFPSDSSEWSDGDADGVGDNGDAFPSDANETADSDGDGVGDNTDAFPNNSAENFDSDGDGVGDNSDEFPNDSNESQDSDGDGIGDNGDEFPFLNNFNDSDDDGFSDLEDDFPNDPTQWSDYDGDGHGDSPEGNDPDLFINNVTQWSDADGDGFGDNWGDSAWNTTRLFIWPGQFVEGAELADHCPTQFGNSSADGFYGCPDDDKDGIANIYDDSNDTENETVELDTDLDGIIDSEDLCPDTVENGFVDSNGCLVDSDGDGIDDLQDRCANTNLGAVINIEGCEVVEENEDETQTYVESLFAGDSETVLKTAGYGALIIAVLGFMQTNFVAAMLPDAVRWVQFMKKKSNLSKEEEQELLYLQSLVQAYYYDFAAMSEELHQLKSELTARFTNNEIKKGTREKINVLIGDLLEMDTDEMKRIAHDDTYFGLAGTIDIKSRNELLEVDLAMRSDDLGLFNETEPEVSQPVSISSVPNKNLAGQINPTDNHEYLEYPSGSGSWYLRNSESKEWIKWGN